MFFFLFLFSQAGGRSAFPGEVGEFWQIFVINTLLLSLRVVHLNQRHNCLYNKFKKERKKTPKCCRGKINTDPRLLLHSSRKPWWRHKPCLVSCEGGTLSSVWHAFTPFPGCAETLGARVHNKHSAL